jgi:hypothetical protein
MIEARFTLALSLVFMLLLLMVSGTAAAAVASIFVDAPDVP